MNANLTVSKGLVNSDIKEIACFTFSDLNHYLYTALTVLNHK